MPKSGVSRRVVSVKEMRIENKKPENKLLLNDIISLEKSRPKRASECVGKPNDPCPFVSCKYHRYLEMSCNTTTRKFNGNFIILTQDGSDIDPAEMENPCFLKSMSQPHNLDEIGESIGVTRERVRQIFDVAAKKIKNSGLVADWFDHSVDSYDQPHTISIAELAKVRTQSMPH